MVESERYERAKNIFRAVLDKPPVERNNHLARACAGDAELHERLQRLLIAVDESGHLTPAILNSLLWEAGLPTADMGGNRDGQVFGAPMRDVEPSITFSPHQMLGRYCIIGKIAEGGMGVVWRAVDTSLDREVAIKLLPANWARDVERWNLLRQEARLVASLSHPNIVVIHAVEEIDDVRFVVMEMVGGRSLRECIPRTGLPLRELLDYAIPLADALAAAHARGITHRDLKPENVMVTDHGWIKVLDFGLATRSPTGRAQGLRQEETLESHNVVAGTPPYMSPEQLRGLPSGPQSDAFSLGIVLYEMAVGERPFAGDSMLDVVASILRDPAPRPSSRRTDLPQEFDAIVASCLEKEASSRAASAHPVLEALREIRRQRERTAMRNLTVGGRAPTGADEVTLMSASSVEVPHTLAVVPFQDLSRKQDQDYLCVGIAEDISTALSRIEGLRVTAVSRMDRQTVDPLEMGRMLGVEAYLDGSVARADDQIRVTVRLVNVSDAAQLWSARFDRAVDAAFRIQDDVAKAVSSTFQLRVAPAQPGAREPDPAAYAAHLKGRFFWGKRYEGGLKRALERFDAAIALDNDMPAAHAGRADCFVILGHYGVLDPTVAYAQARESAQRALDLVPDHAEAHATMGWIAGFYDWSWEEAGEWFRRALELDPKYATAWEWNGLHLLSRRQSEKAVASLRAAQRADPLSLMISSILGWALHTVGEDEEATDVLNNVLEMDPRFVFAHTILTTMLATNGNHDAAVDVAERGAMLSGRESLSLAYLGYAYACAGREEDAQRVTAEISVRAPEQYVSSYHLALLHLGAGRHDEALMHLERSVEARETFFASVYFDPAFDPVRKSRRFRELLRQMNVADLQGDHR